uniref:Tetratricopeptide repeat protein 29 n=1 Tax=Dendroctonus ponderosae TaxID=77166 RepID=A0AAR5P3I2_DENPD
MAKKKPVYADLVEMFRLKSVSRSKILSRSKSVTNTFDFEENFIKRERMRKMETQKEIGRMRAELPKYTLNDIRMFKLPFHEALILQLEETGYASTEAYIQQLFQIDEQLRLEAGPQSFVWTRPALRHSDNELKKLSDALMQAEDEHKKGNYKNEFDTMLRVAIDFAFNYSDWFWLAEDLILQCICTANTFAFSGKHEAISRYVYARILYEKIKNFEKAEEELSITRELSLGKSWNVKSFLPEQTDSSNTLFMSANYLLHLCYMRQAKLFFKIDCNQALEFASLAKKRAVEACYHDGETMALYIKGQCELNLGQTKDAVSTFNKAFYIQSKLKSEKGMCEARVELSKAYLMHGSTRLALNTLLALKAMAEEHGFQFYLAQAYRYLGEYYLTCGEPHKATPLLSDALHTFHSIGLMAEADQVRNVAALSSGLELMPLYIPLLQKTDKRFADGFENLLKLAKWKDSREPFWKQRNIQLSGKDILTSTMDATAWEQFLAVDFEDELSDIDNNSVDDDLQLTIPDEAEINENVTSDSTSISSVV